jgi:hypothetical protein
MTIEPLLVLIHRSQILETQQSLACCIAHWWTNIVCCATYDILTTRVPIGQEAGNYEHLGVRHCTCRLVQRQCPDWTAASTPHTDACTRKSCMQAVTPLHTPCINNTKTTTHKTHTSARGLEHTGWGPLHQLFRFRPSLLGPAPSASEDSLRKLGCAAW